MKTKSSNSAAARIMGLKPPAHLWIPCIVLLLFASSASAQLILDSNLRSGPKVLHAFQDVVQQASQATVRVLADKKPVALGAVITSDGYIITKASELHGKIVCQFNDGNEVPATVVGIHDNYDLAMLKVDVKRLHIVDWRPSKDIRVGQWVASTGTGPDPIAIGVISVGTRKLKPGDQPSRISSNKSGWLGVGLEETEGGARISKLINDTPAAKANLRIGDIVIEAAGNKILDTESLINIVQRHRPGEDIALKLRRGEEMLEIKVTLARPPAIMMGNKQEFMGNKLSDRRGGFPTILQHDTVLKPADCGGPLVDLEGKVVGINIARAGRTESYAIPSEDVLSLLTDLKSGKLAPKEFHALEKHLPKGDDPKVLLFERGTISKRQPSAKFREGCFFRTYELKLQANQDVIIELESSDFDAYLHLEDSTGKQLAEDDDSGGDLNSRIEFHSPKEDTYRITVTTCNPNQTGAYELTVRKK